MAALEGSDTVHMGCMDPSSCVYLEVDIGIYVCV